MDALLSALNAIPVRELNYQEWINVGMALHAEGYDCSVWDVWSRPDHRYHAEECDKKWRTFGNSSRLIKGGTIIQMAKERGWSPYMANEPMDWDDVLYDDGDGYTPYIANDTWSPTQELISYLETLFEPDDLVSYVSTDAWQDREGRWVPSKGVCDRTASELISSLKKYPDDIGATIGDYKPQAGAWIRFNPMDGDGVKNANVTRFNFALVESDSLPIAEQDAILRRLELPIATLVHSGGKSLHALVRIDAKDYDEYRKRVDFLYSFLEKNGLPVDKQNRNPSRLSRMPGVMRNGNRQYLVGTNLGRKSWTEWMDFVEGANDELPDIISLDTYLDNLPEKPPELIQGILRKGHKMLISGSSKAGKSFLLMELCIALAEGREWLGFKCAKSKVLYVNLEIDSASCINRFYDIYKALGIKPVHAKDIQIWNLRGHAIPLDQLVPKLIRRIKNESFDAVIIDPIYKVITGDENNASDMGYFCNQFDKICNETGCSTIYCHHHSKGLQGNKKAMDRASGSGVFARDPDAQLDMIEVELDDNLQNYSDTTGATPWRLESNLREFRNIKPVNFWFEYPIHKLDDLGQLETLPLQGSFDAVRMRNKKCTTPETRRESVISSYAACAGFEEPVTLKAMAEYLNVTDHCVRDRVKELPDMFTIKKGFVFRKTAENEKMK